MLRVPKLSDSHPPPLPAGRGEMIVLSRSSLPLVEDPELVARTEEGEGGGESWPLFLEPVIQYEPEHFQCCS